MSPRKRIGMGCSSEDLVYSYSTFAALLFMNADRARARSAHGPVSCRAAVQRARWSRSVLVSALCGLASGCGADASSSDSEPTWPSGSPPAEEDPESGLEVRFESANADPLAPRQQRELVVLVSPPKAHTVRLGLLDARDAALDVSSVVTDTQGRARVWLTAPSSTGPFGVRAQVGATSTDLALSVSARELATVEIVPVYTGRRNVLEWVASVHVGRSCAEFDPIPEDSVAFARFSADQTAQIANVALGPELAVTVRAGQFVGGCADVTPGFAGDTLRIEVPVSDRRLDLRGTFLEVALGLGDRDSAFLGMLEEGVRQTTEAFRTANSTDFQALLDTMELGLDGRARERFRTARAEANWEVTSSSSADNGAPHLSLAIASWVEVGRKALLSARAFETRLLPSDADPEQAPSLVVDRMGQIDADRLDLQSHSLSWDSDSSDWLSFKATLVWDHARLITELARGPALAETGASSVADALSIVAQCEELGPRLVSSDGPAVALLNASCGPTCLSALCSNALSQMWDRAYAESSAGSVALSLAAAGTATVGEQAQAIGLEGNWIGKLTHTDVEEQTAGTVRGNAPRYSLR